MLPETDDFRRVVRRYAQTTETNETKITFDPKVWEGLAQLGVLGLGTEAGGGGATEIATAMEELGASGFVGPLIEGVIASQVVDSQQAEVLAEGGIASVSFDPNLAPWAKRAAVFLLVDDDFEIWETKVEVHEVLETLGRDEWMTATSTKLKSLGAHPRVLALADLAVAAYVLGAAAKMLKLTADYTKDRHQFGTPIGKFQAISHPLANCYARVYSARMLAISAVATFDDASASERDVVTAAARVRLLASTSAELSAQVSFQSHGGMGFVDDTLLTHLGRRVRQVGLLGRSLNATAVAAAPWGFHPGA